MSDGNIDPLEEMARARKEKIEEYYRGVYNKKEFQDGLKFLSAISNDYIIALKSISMMGSRFGAQDKLLSLANQDFLTESLLMALEASLQGMRNVCRRELRYILEASVKFHSLDQAHPNLSLTEKGLMLDKRDVRFEDYVEKLEFFDDFQSRKDFKSEILSLYSTLSQTTHATYASIQEASKLSKRGIYTSMENVSSLNTLSKNVFQVLDISLVLLFHSIGLSLAGDTFIICFDDEKSWKFHRGKYISELSKCFDYKSERKV